MDTALFNKLHAEGLIGDASIEKIRAHQEQTDVSIQWELKTLLYIGVLLVTSGLGILVYKNIDTIGHTAILLFVALLSAGGFYYCIQKKAPFSRGKVVSPNALFDYILLLACLCFVMLVGYWQYAYSIFGQRYGLATFIPMVVLFISAYFFDHLGILSLAITNFAAWIGIAVTPSKLLQENDFNSSAIIFTALALGVALILVARISTARNLKAHFAFTYTNFGMHLLFISCLAGLFHFTAIYFIWFVLLAGIAFLFYREALSKNSFYFLMTLTLYTYTGLSYVVMRFLFFTANVESDGGIYLAFFYFIGSGIGLIRFLIIQNKKLKTP